MKKATLCTAWGALYIICAGLGFIHDPEGALRIGMIAAAVVFFLPPVVLLIRFPDTRPMICRISAMSLGTTLVLLVANILAAVRGSGAVGTFLHVLLALFSAPMFCGVYWVMSLFLWAALLFASLGKKGRTEG